MRKKTESQRTKKEREEESCWKITLNVPIQQRPAVFGVSYIFKGVLWVERKYLNARRKPASPDLHVRGPEVSNF